MADEIVTVFRSRLRPEHRHEYEETAERMDALARSMPGFVDAKTFVAADGERVTVVTFADADSQRSWRDHPEHRDAQRLGVERYYSTYTIQVGAVAYQHRFHHQQGTETIAPPRPSDDEVVDLLEALRWQHAYVVHAGSPTAAEILQAVIDDVASGGDLATALPARVRFGDLPGLRVMAAVHLLALTRRAPAVALHLPTLGGTPPAAEPARRAFHRAVVDALMTHDGVLRDSLDRVPQTNETQRASLLRCALSREDATRPVRLHEIGASAGLNLRADHLPGQPDLEVGPLPPVVERVGCDLHPVDLTTTAGRALLTSYVWVDDVHRFERLRRAMEVAARVPAVLVQEDAAAFTARLRPVEGTLTVLWHSAMWLYLPRATAAAVRLNVAAAGAFAGPDAPFVHVSWEWDTAAPERATFSLVTRRWDGSPDDGTPQRLATGLSHGGDVRLLAQRLDQDPLARD